MEIDRVKAISDVDQTLIETAEVELLFSSNPQALPKSQRISSMSLSRTTG